MAYSLADLVRRFRAAGNDGPALADKAAIQLNDTHPTMAVPELMRLLLDEAKLPWEEAWSLTQRTLAYTNHTLLPEAREQWPVEWFELLLPRQLEIIHEINWRFLDEVRARFPGDEGRVSRASLIKEGALRQVRMAHLAVVGSHSTNGVAALHSELIKQHLMPDFAAMYPERFNNKTNGVTPRRWLLLANPALARVITEGIGDGWITKLAQLEELKPLADDESFRDAVRRAKREAKTRFADWLKHNGGPVVDPDTLFDTQIKRIHEYKRQLLNVLHVIVLYNRLRASPTLDVLPRTFFFAGKAAPAYHFAKLIIKFINNVAGTIDGDPAVNGRIKVVFVPDYRVSIAEQLIPASDVSEQISTAGYEASGTSNMKFMMNGALTIGTRDGATIEMAEAAGEENFFLFGLTSEQVAASAGWYSPWWHYENEPETRAALDLIASYHFSRYEPGLFAPIVDALLRRGDHYQHLAQLRRGAPASGRVIRGPGGLDAQGRLEHRRFGPVLQRPHHCRIRQRDLGCQTVSDRVNCTLKQPPDGDHGRQSHTDGSDVDRAWVEFHVVLSARDGGDTAVIWPAGFHKAGDRAQARSAPEQDRSHLALFPAVDGGRAILCVPGRRADQCFSSVRRTEGVARSVCRPGVLSARILTRRRDEAGRKRWACADGCVAGEARQRGERAGQHRRL